MSTRNIPARASRSQFLPVSAGLPAAVAIYATVFARIVTGLQSLQESHRAAQEHYERACEEARNTNAETSEITWLESLAELHQGRRNDCEAKARRVVDLLEIQLRRDRQLTNLQGQMNRLKQQIAAGRR